MIKLTDGQGRPIFLKPGTVTALRAPYDGEWDDKAMIKSVVFQGQMMHGVRESVAQVMGALGQV